MVILDRLGALLRSLPRRLGGIPAEVSDAERSIDARLAKIEEDLVALLQIEGANLAAL